MEEKKIRIVSWNVNGLRAVFKKELQESVRALDADILALQETKLQEHQRTEEMMSLNDYQSFWSYSTVKKGYSGVVTYSKIEPDYVKHGIGIPEFDDEGRILETGYGNTALFNVYFPNGQMSDERLQYKLSFYEAFFQYTDALKAQGKSIIITGDFNIAHNEIDLRHPKANQDRSGFLRIERDWLDAITERGYVDTFRYLHPETVRYSWWSYRFNARKTNAGWRIDYFFVTKDLMENEQIAEAYIDNEILGSDHCPVGIVVTLK